MRGQSVATAHLSEPAPDNTERVLEGAGFSGAGFDTAIVVQAASSFGRWRVCEILARPRVGPPSEV